MTTPHHTPRAGSRRAATSRRTTGRDISFFVLGTVLALAAWVYLVHAAIHFGSKGRGGEHAAWALMTLSIVGGIACLFIGLMLLSELVRVLSRGRPSRSSDGAKPPAGGKRAAR